MAHTSRRAIGQTHWSYENRELCLLESRLPVHASLRLRRLHRSYLGTTANAHQRFRVVKQPPSGVRKRRMLVMLVVVLLEHDHLDATACMPHSLPSTTRFLSTAVTHTLCTQTTNKQSISRRHCNWATIAMVLHQSQ